MSSEVAHGAEVETPTGAGESLKMVSGQEEAAVAPGTVRRPTGDDAVDEVLAAFDAVTGEPLDTQIEVGERVHRVLLGRLADLGKV